VQDGERVLEDVKKWESEEVQRHAKNLEKVLHFKALQDEQVRDKEERVRRVCIHASQTHASVWHGDEGAVGAWNFESAIVFCKDCLL
jgi:hypothetical protein